MKSLLLIPYIIVLASSKNINYYNQTTVITNYNSTIENPLTNLTTEVNNSSFFTKNLKECYICNFSFNNSDKVTTMFNDQCENNTVNCKDNKFCSTTVLKNQDSNQYRLQLGCVEENYCSESITERQNFMNEIDSNYSICCNIDFCNNYNLAKALLNRFLEPTKSMNIKLSTELTSCQRILKGVQAHKYLFVSLSLAGVAGSTIFCICLVNYIKKIKKKRTFELEGNNNKLTPHSEQLVNENYELNVAT